MATTDLKQEKSRFDTRLSKEIKDFFEKAARLGCYRSLTDFVVLTIQQKAKKIIAEKEQIIASEKDSALFSMRLQIPLKQTRILLTLQTNTNRCCINE